MIENSQMSTNLLHEFIEMYKQSPCLCQTNSAFYSNRTLKTKTYQKLVNLITPAFPEANVEFIKKKINTMRGCVRKEYKKTLQAQADDMDPNCIYQPTLWYYNLLSFTFNQEMPLYCVSKVEEEDGDDEDMRHENQYEPEYIFSEDPASPHKLRPDSPLSSGSNKHPENRKRIIEPDIFTLAKQYDEFDAIAISIAAKLRKINERNEDQRYMCEKIINDALLKGLFNKLSEDSVIGEIINENQYNNLLSIPPSSNTNNNPLRNCVFVKDT